MFSANGAFDSGVHMSDVFVPVPLVGESAPHGVPVLLLTV